jgi:hypothetical protein
MKKLLLLLLCAVTVQAATSNPISSYPSTNTFTPDDDLILNSWNGAAYKTRRTPIGSLAGAFNALTRPDGPTGSPADVILDTDAGEDIDDMGDLAVLHTLADQGELNILAICYSTASDYGAPMIEAVNRFYGRPNIPIGTSKTAVYEGTDTYGSLAAGFYNMLGSGTNAMDAVSVYRKILASRPQNSVTIVTVGQLRNISDLWNSPADNYSKMTGSVLMTNKVKRLIVVGGVFPTGHNYNFFTDPASAAVLNSMTANIPVSFMGIEQGDAIQIGGNIRNKSTNDIVRTCYDAYFTAFSATSRPAWGGLGLLFAARGYTNRGTVLFTSTKGFVTVNASTGDNTWVNNASANQEYLSKAQADSYYTNILDGLLMRPALSGGEKLDRKGDFMTGALQIRSGATNALDVATNTLLVDALNSRVRVGASGTNMPFSRLDVEGSAATTGIETESLIQMNRVLAPGVRFPQSARFALGGYKVPSSFSPDTVWKLQLKANNSELLNGSATWLDVISAQNNGDVKIKNRLLTEFGSTSSPAYSFSSEPNSGMFIPTPNSLGFVTTGTEAARISSICGIGFEGTKGVFFTPSFGGTGFDSGIVRDSAGVTKSVSSTTGTLAAHKVSQLFVGSGGITVSTGSGTPEGAVTAPVGSIFLRSDGGASTTFYVKQTGTGNTGWAAK